MPATPEPTKPAALQRRPPASPRPSGKKIELCRSRASLLATSAVPEDPSDALLGGLLLTPLLGCKARTPLEWTHAWAMLGEWAGQVAFPIAAPHIGWPRHGHGKYLRPAFIGRTLPFLTWARPIFGQGALSPMSTFPADFPILCLPGDKLFQSKEVDSNHSLPPIVHAFQGNKVTMGRKLQAWQEKGLAPLGTALLAVEHLPPLWTHSNGCDFVRGGRFVVKPRVAATRVLTPAQVLLLQSLWVPVQTPHQFNTQPPWTPDCVAVSTPCGQHASLQLPELSINEIISSHADPKYRDWQTVIIESTLWQINPTDTGDLIAQCTGLGGSELDEEWDVLLACKKDAHVYGPSLSKQDDWNAKQGTIAGTAHTQEYLMLHLGLFPVGAHAWCSVKGPIAPASSSTDHTSSPTGIAIWPNHPAHRKPPWIGYKQSLRLFTKLIAAHPLTGICRPPNLTTAESNRQAEQIGVGLSIRGHSAGSYAGMVWEEILAEFPNFIGTTVLAALAFPPNYMTQPKRSVKRQLQPSSPC